jgi:hypothetical protein
MADDRRPGQMELPLAEAKKSAPALRVISGGGQRTEEPLTSRDAVVRVLVATGADMLLRRISPERAEEIEQQVERVLKLFDLVDARPELMPRLEAGLQVLEGMVRDVRTFRQRRRAP